MHHVTVTKLIAALVVISALFAPAAIARPVESFFGPESGIQPQEGAGSPPAAESSAAVASTGFDWGDAGVGAAGMLVALSMGAAGVLTIRRRHRGGTGPALTG